MTLCSAVWDDAELPAYGTAPRARFWLALEQRGPWGRDAFGESHLDPALGLLLVVRCESVGGRALLIREPGPHADTHVDAPRRVLLAFGGDQPWLLTGLADDPEQLLDLPLASIGPDPTEILAAAPWLARTEQPALLICANGKRDRCCAVRGRTIAGAVAARHPGQVWECSHTGGHRFAPTGVVLPLGQVIGRLDAPLAEAVLVAAARGVLAAESLGPQHDRGRAHLSPADAARESALRLAWADVAVPPLPPPPGLEVAVERRRLHPDLPESCGKDPVATWTWQVEVSPRTGSAASP